MPETPLRRSDATRAAILDAARRRFAVEGYRRATIRAIAADASIDPSMVMRYFGSKDGLLAAAVDLRLKLPDLATVHREKLGEVVTRRFLETWDRPPSGDVLPILLRSAVSDADTLDRLRAVFSEQVTPAVQRAKSGASAEHRAGLIASQLLGLALCRYVLRLPPVVEMSEDRIVADLGPTIQRYLTLDS